MSNFAFDLARCFHPLHKSGWEYGAGNGKMFVFSHFLKVSSPPEMFLLNHDTLNILQSPPKVLFSLISLVLVTLLWPQWFSVALLKIKRWQQTNKQTLPWDSLLRDLQEQAVWKTSGANQRSQANKWPLIFKDTHTQRVNPMYLGFLPVQMQDSWFIFGYIINEMSRFQIVYGWIFKTRSSFCQF